METFKALMSGSPSNSTSPVFIAATAVVAAAVAVSLVDTSIRSLWSRLLDSGDKKDWNAAARRARSNITIDSNEHRSYMVLLEKYWAGDVPQELLELLEAMEYPEVCAQFNSKPPRGILICGEPGTGKTYLAEIIKELVGPENFFYAGASEFDEIYVGRGAQRVRDLFEQASKRAKESKQPKSEKKWFARFSKGSDDEILDDAPNITIIFIDEIDALGSRGDLHSDSSRATLNQLLMCMDGFASDSNVLVIAATNNKKLLDPALLRSGRFDRTIELPKPNAEMRRQHIVFHLKDKPGFDSLKDTKLIEDLADAMEGFNCADIKNAINQAAQKAARRAIRAARSASQLTRGSLAIPQESVQPQDLVEAFLQVYRKLCSDGNTDLMDIQFVQESLDEYLTSDLRSQLSQLQNTISRRKQRLSKLKSSLTQTHTSKSEDSNEMPVDEVD